MTDPADMIVPLLREMRAENLAQHEQTRVMIAALDKRLCVEGAQSSFRQALTADSLLSKLVTGEFEERIEALENKVKELEGHK
ncbi:hypothetical protein JQ604_09895 [Bradyrhizobium jicamae]|uniref:hypothetical protein n=1 Tax=Bradyrhizobium jicamae TaxID=280332 RepID=UPI001BA453D0|nr:hypothetical protein [Bradyrhizobium jicamae]MBR0752498.1 hypothetical protein [Bradyrhizobium jicamae]